MLTLSDPWTLACLLAALPVGSFIALASVRLPLDEPVLLGRSHCRSCGISLRAIELIPLLSYWMQRGQCRSCNAPISKRYPVIEGAALGIALWAATVLSGAWLAITCLLGWSLLLVSILDAQDYWLPLPASLALLKAGLIVAIFLPHAHWLDHAIGAAAGIAFLLGVGWLFRRVRGHDGLGDGDPWFFGAAGAWVGWQGLPSVLLWACAGGLAWALGRSLHGASIDSATKLAFGPALALGLWLTWLYGPLGVY